MLTSTIRVDHKAILEKFRYRLDLTASPEDRARLASVIATYTRLYG